MEKNLEIIEKKEISISDYTSHFNYSEFEVTEEEKDYFIQKEEKLLDLGQKAIKVTLEIGKELAEVQEKISKRGNGMFAPWFENLGLKKNFVYREIARWKMFEKYQIPAIAEASIRTIEFLKQNQEKIADDEIEEILEVPEEAPKKIKEVKENMEIKKESVVSSKVEIKVLEQKIDKCFDKIDKYQKRIEELKRNDESNDISNEYENLTEEDIKDL